MENFIVFCRIQYQKIRENIYLTHLALLVLLFFGKCMDLLNLHDVAFKVLSQVHRSSRSLRMKQLVEPTIFHHLEIHYHAGQYSKNSQKLLKYFGNRIMILKPKISATEPGVLYIMFSEMMRQVALGFNLPKLMSDYLLIFEPSWSGYCDQDFLFYTKFEQPIFVLAAEEDDYRFLSQLDTNLLPIHLGPSDWVDPSIAEPYLGQDKRYDIIMNSNWGAWKRHYILFEMLSRLDRPLKVALIGIPWGGRTGKDIMALAAYYKVEDRVTLYERIPYAKVMEVTCQSRCSILLSLKEGSNRAISESIFCDIPVVILQEHVGGIKKNIVPQTGEIVPQKKLGQAIKSVLDNRNKYQPREWGLQNISCFVSTEKLNSILKKHAQKRGHPWTCDIVVRSNCPESRYVDPSNVNRFISAHKSLSTYLIRA